MLTLDVYRANIEEDTAILDIPITIIHGLIPSPLHYEIG